MRTIKYSVFGMLLLTVILLCISCRSDREQNKAAVFTSPEDAAVAMIDALKSETNESLLEVFGPEAREAIESADPEADRVARELIVAAYYEFSALDGDDKEKTLIVGGEHWQFPVPIVKVSGGWSFDTLAGIEEIRDRRIGRNELATIDACRTYVAAQEEYAAKGHDGKPPGAYAQKFESTPGKQDGLYWEVQDGEEQSPLGPLLAEAAAEGTPRTSTERTPFHGYYFRILSAQGASASGGAKGYLKNGEMRGGFALLAYPAQYGESGLMTFMVNQEGIVFESDLGPETADIAEKITEFDPQSGWAPSS